MSELTTTYEWSKLTWRKLERRVFKLQKRIYRASQRGDVKTVHRLQRLLMKSWSAKCLAVRRVTQDNQGKKTAGVDGRKNLSPKARLTLANDLKLGYKAAPTRRIWIPKPGTEEKRPLGIPTIQDRALQALVKLALEPEWEAKFEPNSYGFRPGRSCHDAMDAIFKGVKAKAKYVLDADISKCFDRINHDALLRKLNTSPTTRRQIRAWLKAGVMDGSKLFPTFEGTPQGGIISPLLANIALHGMENRIKQAFPEKKPRVNGKCIRILSPILIRYADDFVIMHEDLTVVQKCQQIIAEWLKDMGLELKSSKTRLTHTLYEHEGSVGFDFLGFHIRQYATGKNRSVKGTNGKLLGFKPLITPSKEKVKEHLEKVGKIIKAHKGAPQLALITRLNPIIRGWARYYSTQASKATFTKVDHLMHQQLRAWADYRHPQKNKHWVSNKYWLIDSGQGWTFAVKGKMRLLKHSETPIVRHIKVQGNRSPYDGDWIYWSSRMGQHPEANKRVTTLLKKQKGKCAHCGMYFKDEDLLEVHHVIPVQMGGKDEYKNFQLLHRHCHDIVTAENAVGKKELNEEWLDANPF
ncbi:group II intron reverse transcriptase/maturase [Floridanema aerugineum]|uniref:Group II intron reverse transcriptase/maturase n=1 Tax=Floridaenema aerugineum BLCC-F46 TaxID=3153654 RepID=A0ABV4WYF9_9CYAN